MQLDVRIPIGVMFAILGVMLFAYGLLTASDAEMYARSLGYNVNLWWGLFLALFGGAMLALARRAARHPRASRTPHESEAEGGSP